jgi:hypothetical protein
VYHPFTTYRVDCYPEVDGFFDEDWHPAGQPGCGHAGCGLMGLRKPAMIWTYTADAVRNDPAFFDRHLLLGVFPTVPFPGNDHSICPDPVVDALYLDYAPLLAALAGKKWVLTPHSVEVEGDRAQANLFEVPGGLVAPVVFGPRDDAVTLVVRNVAEVNARAKIEVLHPGAPCPQPLPAEMERGVAKLRVPLKGGCAVVRWTGGGR